MSTVCAVLLATPDAERLRGWYHEVLGPEHGRGEGIVLLFDARPGELARPAAEPGRLTLTVRVPDRAAAASRMRRAGTRWVDWDSGTDHDGNVLRLCP